MEGRDIRRLKTGWFFQDDGSGSSPGTQFVEWCRGDAEHDDQLVRGLSRLIRGTALATGATTHLFDVTADAMAQSMGAWRREVDALRKDAEQFRGGEQEPRAPAILAIERQLRRLEGEYLLAELANRQFLPGYGFPNGIVSFVPTTIDELKRRKADREGREEAFGKRSGYPSRQMETAIREYAPGAEIVMDGRVYQSSGVTLNWHIPPGVESLNEVQALRHVWRCRQCGVTGDTLARPERCPHCDGSPETRKYLEPAGFAVDIRHSPHKQRRVSNLYSGRAALDKLSDPRMGIVRRPANRALSLHRLRSPVSRQSGGERSRIRNLPALRPCNVRSAFGVDIRAAGRVSRTGILV